MANEWLLNVFVSKVVAKPWESRPVQNSFACTLLRLCQKYPQCKKNPKMSEVSEMSTCFFRRLCHIPIILCFFLRATLSKLSIFCQPNFSLQRESFLGHACTLWWIFNVWRGKKNRSAFLARVLGIQPRFSEESELGSWEIISLCIFSLSLSLSHALSLL